ncbi:unnamed protein product [Pieris brassicae]|uniref:Uncharacterized protein n=1 Tax=Pieris brassicae TaxID=7116 RepID=A0A9P0TYV0_PIEBR|nr:unnamed protein product [Pieris brassicae]
MRVTLACERNVNKTALISVINVISGKAAPLPTTFASRESLSPPARFTRDTRRSRSHVTSELAECRPFLWRAPRRPKRLIAAAGATPGNSPESGPNFTQKVGECYLFEMHRTREIGSNEVAIVTQGFLRARLVTSDCDVTHSALPYDDASDQGRRRVK